MGPGAGWAVPGTAGPGRSGSGRVSTTVAVFPQECVQDYEHRRGLIVIRCTADYPDLGHGAHNGGFPCLR